MEEKKQDSAATTEEKKGLFIEIISDDEQSVMTFGESKLHYRRMGQDTLREIRNEHTTVVGKDRQGRPLYETDETAVDRDVVRWMLTGWDNVKHPVTGEFLKIDDQYKDRLPNTIKTHLISRAFSPTTEQEIKN